MADFSLDTRNAPAADGASNSIIENQSALSFAHRRDPRWAHGVPIYIAVSSDVPSKLYSAIIDGALDVVAAAGDRRPVLFLGATWGAEERQTADSYLSDLQKLHTECAIPQPSEEHGPQLNADFGVDGLIATPFKQELHWQVMVVNQDLFVWNETGSEYVFGSSLPFASFQSITRFLKDIEDPADQAEALRRLIRHEVGHMYGLPDLVPGRRIDQALGEHCLNVCTMRQAMEGTAQWLEQLKEEVGLSHFCAECKADLQRLWGAVGTPPGPPPQPEALRTLVGKPPLADH